MKEFWILILISFFATNTLDKAESVKLEELPFKTFDEIFGEGWDKDEAEEWHKLTLELGQIEPNSTDQNPPLTESDHSNNVKNVEEQNEIMKKITSNAEDERKRNIIDEFHAIKEEFKQKGKFPRKERIQIEEKIAKHLKVNRKKIYKWKKEFGLSQKVLYKKEEHKYFVEKFDQMKAELNRDGFKSSYRNELDKTVAKKLGLSVTTIYNWKRKLGQSTPQHKYSHNEKKELMKSYNEIKHKNSKISDEDITKMLKIGKNTLYKWKKQFKQQQLDPNSVDGHSVEENVASSNAQQIENENSGSI